MKNREAKAKPMQVQASEHAFLTKSAKDPAVAQIDLNEPTPGDGRVRPVTEHHTPMGAFGAEGNEPVLRRSRHVR